MVLTESERVETMNSTLETIYERRAVRKYKDTPVDIHTLEMIISAGKMAPSAMNRQPWRFYILRNGDNIRRFSEETVASLHPILLNAKVQKAIKKTLAFFHLGESIIGEDPVFHGAPVVILITAPRRSEWAGLDIGMCAQNIMLAAKSFGLDTCPVGFAKYIERTRDYAELGIPKNEKIQLAVILGYGDEQPEPHKRVMNTLTYVD